MAMNVSISSVGTRDSPGAPHPQIYAQMRLLVSWDPSHG
jgi:hypothetical protein